MKTCILFLLIAMVLLSLLGASRLYLLTNTDKQTIRGSNSNHIAPPSRLSATTSTKTEKSTTLESFYQTIIDNNIFRPLGWQPPRKQPDYTLIGTAVSQNVTDSKAFILDRRSHQLHIVKVGDTLDDARVKEIQLKRVTLHEAGKDIILHGGRLQFF